MTATPARPQPMSYVLGRRRVPYAGALIGGTRLIKPFRPRLPAHLLQRSIESRVDRPKTSADSADVIAQLPAAWQRELRWRSCAKRWARRRPRVAGLPDRTH